MQPRPVPRKRRTITLRRVFELAIRAVVIASMSFAVTFGFLSGAQTGHYDPANFAIGVSALFGAACGIIGLLLSRLRMLRQELRDQDVRIEDMADESWQLREAEERARSFLEAQGDLIVRRDGLGHITYVNDAYCALAGQPRGTLIGTTGTLPVIAQGDAAVTADGTRMHDQKIATADGQRWIAWREVTVRSGPATEVQSVGRDVTDRTLVEQTLAEARDQADSANRAKSRFLAMVSHEIRTPLNGILGMADLLLDTALTPEQATYARAVKTSGDTLLTLIEEVLDFSKIEAGKLDLEARPFPLAPMVEELVELLGPRAQAKGLEIACLVDDRLADHVVGDVTRLRQVLFNLAGNAIKFTDQGGVTLMVEPGIWPDEVLFQVRDTGPGIPAEAQARIFEEFEQADSGSRRRFSGTGLGLAISKRIIERMGGRISVDSAPGHGACFAIAVPLPAAEGASVMSPPDLGGREVLIVAPAAIAGSLIAQQLLRWGARTCVVPDGQVAAALLPERRWDTLIVDHALGSAAATALLAQCPLSLERRIVLITPSARHELPALKSAGFTGYLVKPVRAASLAARFADAADGFEPSADAGRDQPARSTAAPGLAVLVAEDNEINALLVRALLTKLGHRPSLATSGSAAVESWLAARDAGMPFDLVLMDVHMPGMDGLEATQQIRAAEAETAERRTTIIALTANAYSEDRAACLAAGMDGFVVKPLDRERLAAAIAEQTPALAA